MMPTLNNGFTIVSRQVKTTFQEDTFPLTEDTDNLGGFRVVANTAALQHVPLARQKQGMWAVTQDLQNVYFLQTVGTNPVWVFLFSIQTIQFQWIELYNQTAAVTINRNNLDIHFNASAGPINQTLPSIAILSLIFPTFRIRLWKDDSSANAVNILTSDGYNGFMSPLSLSLQGASLELDINTNLVKWDVI